MTTLKPSDDIKIDIKRGLLTKSSGSTSLMGNYFWKSRFFEFEARVPRNAIPGPEHLSLMYTVKTSDIRQVYLQNCTPDDVQVVTEEERQESRDSRVRKKENLFAINSTVAEKGPRTYYLEAINHEDMMSWVCKLKEYLSRGELFAVVVEPNQGIQAGNALLTFQDNCLILLCVLTKYPLGVWQLRTFVSFGLEEQTLWFNTEQNRPPKTLHELRNLTLSDVEDYITLVVDSQHTGPRIINTLKRLIEDRMNKAVVMEPGQGMVYFVKDDRISSKPCQIEESKTSSSMNLKLPKPVYRRCSTSVPSSPSLARKKMTCFEYDNLVAPYHVTDLVASSKALDDKIAEQVTKHRGVQLKIQKKMAQSSPRLKRKVSQIYFSKTSKADTARFVRRQTVEEPDSSDEEREEESKDNNDDDDHDDNHDDSENDNDQHERDVGDTLSVTSSEHEQFEDIEPSASRRVSSCSSDDYTPMTGFDFEGSMPCTKEEGSSSEGDDYVTMSLEPLETEDRKDTVDQVRNGISTQLFRCG